MRIFTIVVWSFIVIAIGTALFRGNQLTNERFDLCVDRVLELSPLVSAPDAKAMCREIRE